MLVLELAALGPLSKYLKTHRLTLWWPVNNTELHSPVGGLA